MWRKTTAKSAHKTSEHKTKDQLVATSNPQPLLSQLQQVNDSKPTLVTLTPDQEELAKRFHEVSDIPMGTLCAQMVTKQDKAPTVALTSLLSLKSLWLPLWRLKYNPKELCSFKFPA